MSRYNLMRKLAAEADHAKATAVKEVHRRAEAAAAARTQELERRLALAEAGAAAAAADSAAAEHQRRKAAKIKEDLVRKVGLMACYCRYCPPRHPTHF